MVPIGRGNASSRPEQRIDRGPPRVFRLHNSITGCTTARLASGADHSSELIEVVW